MPEFEIKYSFLQGVDHHHPGYLSSDASLERVHRTRKIDASNKEEARKELWKLEGHLHGGEIESIEEIKEGGSMLKKRYCEKCKEWVETETRNCPKCQSMTFEARRITDPEEVHKYVQVREPYKDIEEELIQMIAKSGAILEGHFIIGDEC